MEIRTNEIMDKYLAELGYGFWEKTIVLPKGLNRILNCNFLNDKDLVILNSFGHFIPENNIETAIDRCELEYWDNHYRVDDYEVRDSNIKDIYYLGLGLEFAKQLTYRLQKEFSNRNFRLSLSFGKVEDPDVVECGNCVVRFYTIREEAEIVFKIENLNEFKEEGIIEIELRN